MAAAGGPGAQAERSLSTLPLAATLAMNNCFVLFKPVLQDWLIFLRDTLWYTDDRKKCKEHPSGSSKWRFS